MKTYTELEEIGIMGMYREDMVLYVITRGGDVWRYNTPQKIFTTHRTL